MKPRISLDYLMLVGFSFVLAQWGKGYSRNRDVPFRLLLKAVE